ncbi:YfiR/HmsC family protein [Thalassotalea ganghwensis]
MAKPQLSGAQVKAAYLFNFLKKVSWPEQSEKKNYRLTLYGDGKESNTIKSVLTGQSVNGLLIIVEQTKKLEQLKASDLVFINQQYNEQVADIAAQLRKTSTLLVTDNSADRHNVMINLTFNPETSAMSFEVNKSNIIFEGLSMSPELLLLGGTELDVATLYRESELALQQIKQRELTLTAQLNEQQQQFLATQKKLAQLNASLAEREQVAKQRQEELQRLKESIEQQKEALNDREKLLDNVSQQLAQARESLAKQTQTAEEQAAVNQQLATRIEINRQTLDIQEQQIAKQGSQLNKKNQQIAQGQELIDQQKFYLSVLAVLTAITLLFLIVALRLFFKNRKTTAKLSNTLANLQNMQEQLVQSEKLASLGKLTAGVAHEINTPLGIAVTSTSAVLEQTEEIVQSFDSNSLSKSKVKRYLDNVKEASVLNTSSLERVIELLNNFKQVAADHVVGEEREFDIVEYIVEIMQTFSAELKRHHVKFNIDADGEIKISTYPGAIAQVITNLVTNSIRHGFEGRENCQITIKVSQGSKGVELRYIDNGSGMSQEVLRNVFEPFYTTKRNSGGTGLGMNIVYNVISQKLKGTIEVTSELDKGVCFDILLPRQLS